MFAFPPIVTFSLSVETFLPAETRHKMIAQKKIENFFISIIIGTLYDSWFETGRCWNHEIIWLRTI